MWILNPADSQFLVVLTTVFDGLIARNQNVLFSYQSVGIPNPHHWDAIYLELAAWDRWAWRTDWIFGSVFNWTSLYRCKLFMQIKSSIIIEAFVRLFHHLKSGFLTVILLKLKLISQMTLIYTSVLPYLWRSKSGFLLLILRNWKLRQWKYFEDFESFNKKGTVVHPHRDWNLNGTQTIC